MNIKARIDVKQDDMTFSYHNMKLKIQIYISG